MRARSIRLRGRELIVVAGAGLSALGIASGAQAADGGVGGVFVLPSVTSFTCVSRCNNGGVGVGGVVRVNGSNLEAARTVVFLGGKGSGDDKTAKAQSVTSSRVEVTVPRATSTGPVRLGLGDGSQSSASRASLKISGDFDDTAHAPPVAHSRDIDAQISSKRVFFYSRTQAKLTYRLKGSRAQDVRVLLVRLRNHAIVASWSARAVKPGTAHSVSWRGTAGRENAPAGSYDFRVVVGSSAARSSSGGREFSAGSFSFLSDYFPVRGNHSYRSSDSRFGAGRAGHRHQGQDVWAACGTPLVAARGGRVRWRASQSAAGNYLVIDGAGTSLDTVYMHLTAPALVQKGQTVYTGQKIGYVGATGDAQGCHLHFEIWSGGWYQSGGHPIDPLGYLKAWDRVS